MVDFVLLSTSQRKLDRLAEDHLRCQPEVAPEDASIGEEHYGIESIPILRAACPGIKILVCTQYAKPDELSRQALLYKADAGVPKQRDQEGKLLDRNAQEIAAKVRELVE